ncbi:hypothetical protein SSS_05385 [Sarcoptes scabiei]|uniref:Uncharacterized protein n=1 Tax=Sarcoptes scabiei TaxID=52283 RepID=A0A834R9I2_SARSC|nr:hypothetical protein SSS_05385 [Sarcoptes scabiei]
MKDSSIVYMRLKPSLGNSHNYHRLTYPNRIHHHWQSSPSSSLSSTSTIFSRPSISSFLSSNSNFYKLPLKFVSNAKPIEIVYAIADRHIKNRKPSSSTSSSSSSSSSYQLPASTSFALTAAAASTISKNIIRNKFVGQQHPHHPPSSANSKIFMLPTKFVSNAKPILIQTLNNQFKTIQKNYGHH